MGPLAVVLDLAGTFVFALSGAAAGVRRRLDVFDAAGLALFAVAGAHKALAVGLDPVVAALLGMLTGVGGGMARDVLLAEVPTVLRAELYALAALAGAAAVVAGGLVGVPDPVAMGAGAALCFGLRLLAIRRNWHLPVARRPVQADPKP
jgi:uncharacterized membrane protein YeiH